MIRLLLSFAFLLIVTAPSHPAPFEPLCLSEDDVPACQVEFDLPSWN